MPARISNCDVPSSTYCDVASDNNCDVTGDMLLGNLVQSDTESQNHNNDQLLLRTKHKSLDSAPLATITNSSLLHSNGPLANSARLRGSTLVPLLNRTHAVATTTQSRAKYVRQRSAPKLSVSTERSEAVVTGNAKRRSESLGEQKDTQDSDKRQSDGVALERQHVHEVYDRTAHHFGDARYRAWPHVRRFLARLPVGAIVADVGCGHGKYLKINRGAFKLGSDRSAPLAALARSRDTGSSDVMVCDNLALPYRSSSLDAVISIGVIHHFSTVARRIRALNELARVLSPGGTVMVYVWALEQQKRQFKSQDVLVPWHLKQKAHARNSANQNASQTSHSNGDSSHGDESGNTTRRRRSLTRHQSAPCLITNDRLATGNGHIANDHQGQYQATVPVPEGAQEMNQDEPITEQNGLPLATTHINPFGNMKLGSGDTYITSACGTTSLRNESFPSQNEPISTGLDSNPPINQHSSTYQTSQPTSSQPEHVPSPCVQRQNSEFVVIESVISPSDTDPSQKDLSSTTHNLPCDTYQTSHNPMSMNSQVELIEKVSKNKGESSEDRSNRKISQPSTNLASVLKQKFTSLFSKKPLDQSEKCETPTLAKNDSIAVSDQLVHHEFLVEGFAVREFPQSSRPALSPTDCPEDNQVPEQSVVGESMETESGDNSNDDVFEPVSRVRKSNGETKIPDILERNISGECSTVPALDDKFDERQSIEESRDECNTWEATTSLAIQRMESKVSLNSQMTSTHSQGHASSYQPSKFARHFSDSDMRPKRGIGARVSDRLARALIGANNSALVSGTISQGGGSAGNTPLAIRRVVSQSSSVSSLSSDNASDVEIESLSQYTCMEHSRSLLAERRSKLSLKTPFANQRNATTQSKNYIQGTSSETDSKNSRSKDLSVPDTASQQDTSGDDSAPNVSSQHSKSCDKNTFTSQTDETDSESNTGLQRYYHVFRQGELDALITNHVTSLEIIESSYDHANWCIVARKRPG